MDIERDIPKCPEIATTDPTNGRVGYMTTSEQSRYRITKGAMIGHTQAIVLVHPTRLDDVLCAAHITSANDRWIRWKMTRPRTRITTAIIAG